MPRRYTFALFFAAALPLAAVALAEPEKPTANEVPAPPKLERKDYTEKVAGFRTVADATTKQVTKIDMTSSFEMVYVPGGEVTVGSPETEAGRLDNEGPRYKAKVGNFWMGKFEVRWEDWDVFW